MKISRENYVITGFIVIAVLFFFACALRADTNHHHQYTQSPQMITQVIGSDKAIGVPLSISMSQIDFSYTSKKWQGGVGFGYFKQRTAISGSVGKKFKNTLVKLSAGIEEGNIGAGAGIVFQFN